MEIPIKPVKSSSVETTRIPAIKKPDPVELVRRLLRDEELVRPVRIPLQNSTPSKRKVRKLKDRKPTLPTRVILPPRPSIPITQTVERPVLLIKPLALPPPSKLRPRIYIEPIYPTTSPNRNRLPQQPSKFVIQSTLYHTLSEPSIRDHTPPPRIQPLPPRSTPVWTELYRRQAISQADEVVVVPEIKSLPPRPVRIKTQEPINIPQPIGIASDWIDVTEFEMPIRGARRRHLVLPADNTFERQMKDLTLEINKRRLNREESQNRRKAQAFEDYRQIRDASIEAERRRRMRRRPMSMPPVPRFDIRAKSRTPEYSPRRREKTPELPKVTPLPPSKMDDWNVAFKKRAARALGESYHDSSSYHSMPHRRKAAAPSRFWMPSNEYHNVTFHHAVSEPEPRVEAPRVEATRPSPDIEDHKLRLLKDDIELNKRRRLQLRQQRMDEMATSRSVADDDVTSVRSLQFEMERNSRQKRMRSMPPIRPAPLHHVPLERSVSPVRRHSPGPTRQMRGTESQRQRSTRARGLSMPPEDLRSRHVAHLPIQPSKFWLGSGEYHHTIDDELKLKTLHTDDVSQSHYEQSDAMKKLQLEFERDRQRREERRQKHERELALAKQQDEASYYYVTMEREKRQMRQASMPPLPRREYIKAENIPKTKMPRTSSPPAAYKPARSSAREQEIEIETITKRINENIEEYEESLKRRQHYTIPVKKVITPSSHVKARPKAKWSNLYTTVTQKVEEKSESEEEDEWVTIRRRRNKRHLVVPSSEMSKSLKEESAAVPRVLVSHRSLDSKPSRHGAYDVVEINERDIDHTRQPLPKPHFTEDVDFDSDWHAMTPHVRNTRERVRVNRTTRVAAEKHAPTYDKRTPAADNWLSARSHSRVSSSESSGSKKDYMTSSKTSRHLVTPPFAPRRVPMRNVEPLSVTMLDKKARHTRHAIEEKEFDSEPVIRRRAKSSRHNLAMPGWNPGEPTSGRPSRRETPPRAGIRASSPVDYKTGRGRSFTPFDESVFSSPSPIRQASLGRRATSVSYIPRATPARDASYSFEQRSRYSGSVERSSEFGGSSVGYGGSGGSSDGTEHHVHPMRDTFKVAVDRVRERLPWRQVYNESMDRVHTKPQACK